MKKILSANGLIPHFAGLSSAIFFLTLVSFSQDNEKKFLQKAQPDLIRDFKNGKDEFWIILKEQVDVSGAKLLKTKDEKGQYVFDKLTETASRTQAPFISLLKSKGVEYQNFWIANSIFIKGDINLAKELSSYESVKEFLPNPNFYVQEPIDAVEETATKKDATSVFTIEWNINKVNAPQVWAMGFKGQGVVVSGQDTGVEYDNLCLETQYRGYTGGTPNHNFNWHDAIHTGTNANCGINLLYPCDDNNHGTHTMGTMVGDDQLGNQVGMAPQAQWIASRNMNNGAGTPVTYTECFQWFLAPTDLNNQNPTPSKAPHVINNSWGCPASEGCTLSNFSQIETAIANLRAAGVVVVASAGNSGPNCNTVQDPPAIFDESFSVGATTNADAISGFSSRGNVSIDASGRLKPDVSAPGSSVRSSIRNGAFATYSGTSMAGPHVVGAVALLISAAPSLAGNVDSIERILEKTAVHINGAQTCNGTTPSMFPNNTVGYGRIDILAAVNYVQSVTGTNNLQQFANGVTVFPTLAKENIYFRFENPKDERAEIKFFTAAGQLVMEKNMNVYHDTHGICIEELQKGFYLYSVKTENNSYNGKFLKQ